MTTPGSRRRELEADHTPDAISARLQAATKHSYLRDFVFGAVDGAVTTFAVVSGVAGAEFSGGVAIVLGLANLLADGFSMAAGNYLSTKTEHELVARARRAEERHIDLVPHGEREEVRQIFAAKGFTGEVLDQAVEVITQNRRQWVDTMLTDELGLRLDSPSPFRAAAVTFAAFCVAGLIPLAPFFFLDFSDVGQRRLILIASTIGTAVAFLAVGLLKGYLLERSRIRSALETLLVGGCAAALAYVVGVGLHRLGVGGA